MLKLKIELFLMLRKVMKDIKNTHLIHSESKSVELDIENQFNTERRYGTILVVIVIYLRESQWAKHLSVL